MAHQLLYKTWQSETGKWYCNDVSDLGGQAGKWWIPAYLLGISASEYVQWLIDNYHPDDIYFDGENFFYGWTKEHYSLCHKFVLYINAQARKKKFVV